MESLTQHSLRVPCVFIPGSNTILNHFWNGVSVHVGDSVVHTGSVVVLSCCSCSDYISHLQTSVDTTTHFSKNSHVLSILSVTLKKKKRIKLLFTKLLINYAFNSMFWIVPSSAFSETLKIKLNCVRNSLYFLFLKESLVFFSLLFCLLFL